MIFKVICIGKVKESYYKEMIDSYVRQINKSHSVMILQGKDEGIPKHASDISKQKIIETESMRSMEKIDKTDFVIALCIEGRKYTTQQLADVIRNAEDCGFSTIVFLIGGSLGMSQELIRRANVKMSFSNMTFPHQLMRVMLLDQIAKAATCDTKYDD